MSPKKRCSLAKMRYPRLFRWCAFLVKTFFRCLIGVALMVFLFTGFGLFDQADAIVHASYPLVCRSLIVLSCLVMVIAVSESL